MSNSRFLTTVYAKVQTTDNINGGLNVFSFYGAGGQQRSFFNQGVEVRAVSPKQTLNGVDINSLIIVLPTGLNQKPDTYASVDLATTINTNGQ